MFTIKERVDTKLNEVNSELENYPELLPETDSEKLHLLCECAVFLLSWVFKYGTQGPTGPGPRAKGPWATHSSFSSPAFRVSVG